MTIPPDKCLDVANLVLTTTCFTFDSQFYQKTYGVTMGGTSIFNRRRNLYAGSWTNVISTALNPRKVCEWLVDDIYSILKYAQLWNLFRHISDLHQNINFTMEEERNGKLASAENLLKGNKGKNSVFVYRNPAHTSQYLLCSSHHQASCKESVNRKFFVITNQNDLAKENTRTKQLLKENWYQERIICQIFKRINKNHSFSQSQQQKSQKYPRREKRSNSMNINLPYFEGTSENLRRLLRPHKIRPTFYT